MLRIDKYLADCGIGTRSEVKKHIKAKQITINGELVIKPEQKIDETSDVISFPLYFATTVEVSFVAVGFFLYTEPNSFPAEK